MKTLTIKTPIFASKSSKTSHESKSGATNSNILFLGVKIITFFETLTGVGEIKTLNQPSS